MAYFEWKDSYCVGIDKIDKQHQKLVSLVNDFYEAMSAGKANSVLGEIFEELINYTIIHFDTEEELMTRFGYSAIFTHQKEHNDLKQKVMEYKAKFENGSTLMVIDLSKFLKEWLANHILKTDMAYSEFFKAKGVK